MKGKIVCVKNDDKNVDKSINEEYTNVKHERSETMSEKRQYRRKPTGRPPINDMTKTLVRKLYEENKMTCKDIAAACNISTRSVFRILDEERTDVNAEGES